MTHAKILSNNFAFVDRVLHYAKFQQQVNMVQRDGPNLPSEAYEEDQQRRRLALPNPEHQIFCQANLCISMAR